MLARLPSVGNEHPAKSATRNDAAYVRVVILELENRIKHLPVDELELTHTFRNLEACKPIHDSVEDPADPAHDRALLSVGTDARHHLVALLPKFDKFGKHFRRILEVDREHDKDRIAGCIAQCVERGPEQTKIAGIDDHLYSRIISGNLAQYRGRRVKGCVVGKHMFALIACEFLVE